jgi:hypothetical protein
MVGHRDSDPLPVASGVRDTYRDKLLSLTCTLYELKEARVLMVEDEARKAITKYLDEIEPRLLPEGDLHGIRDWAAKLTGAAVRIAGLLHVAQNFADEKAGGIAAPVSVDTVENAIRLASYYADHARAAFGVMGAAPGLSLARDILRWVYQDGKPRDPFGQRDAHRSFQQREGRSTEALEIGAALKLLESHGWIRQMPPPERSPRGGRPASPRYEVNPFAPDEMDGTPERGSHQ